MLFPRFSKTVPPHTFYRAQCRTSGGDTPAFCFCEMSIGMNTPGSPVILTPWIRHALRRAAYPRIRSIVLLEWRAYCNPMYLHGIRCL